STSHICATDPAGATTGPVSVTTPDGTATSSSSFTVTNPPTITSFAPTSGPAGMSVTINGTNFTGATSVKFNGTTGTFTVTSATQIQETETAEASAGQDRVISP